MTVSRDIEKGKELIAQDGDAGTRVDRFIADRMPEHVSRSRIKEIINSGGLSVDGKPCESPNYRLKPGDRIVIKIPPVVDAAPDPWACKLNIAYEDKHLVVVDKPAGMVVHPAAGNWNKTLVNALLHHCGSSLAGIGGVKRPGIVHRLDKNTSGLIVVAKTEKAHADLTAQFSDHGMTRKLERRYHALVWGICPKKKGTISTYLGRSSHSRIKRAVVSKSASDARLAVTHYQVLNEFAQQKNGQTLLSLVECCLETGRTHQIRVHMSHTGNPIVGDPEYGQHFQSKAKLLGPQAREQFQQLRRQALHATILGFEHPVTGNFIEFRSPFPADIQNLIDQLYSR